MSNTTFKITDGKSRIEETNLIYNPVFAHSTWDYGWSLVGPQAPTAALDNDPDNVKVGDGAARVAFTGADGEFVVPMVNRFDEINGKTLSLSAWVKTTSTTVRLVIDANNASITMQSAYHSGSGEYERLSLVATPLFDQGGLTTYIHAGMHGETGGDVAWLDGVDLVVSQTPTLVHIDGDQPHCQWDGVPHESTSTRSAFTGTSFEFANVDSRVSGFFLDGITPKISGYKGGGTYAESPFTDGRRLVSTKYENVIEGIGLIAIGMSQDDLARKMQDIRRLLVKAKDYWIDEFAESPVWLEARSSCETNIRYAIIHNAEILEDGDMWRTPFLQPGGKAMFGNITLAVERGHWSSVEPTGSSAVKLGVTMAAQAGSEAYGSILALDGITNYTDTLAPSELSSEGNTIQFGAGVTPVLQYYSAGIRFRNVTIPKYANILSAYLKVTASHDRSVSNMNAQIYCQNSGTAAAFIDADDTDFAARPRTSVVSWNSIPSWTTDTEYTSPDITLCVNQVVNNHEDWASGNDMVVFVEGNTAGASATRAFYSTAYAGHAQPRLMVTYEVDNTIGTIDTGGEIDPTDRGVFIANMDVKSSITHAFVYDASAGTFGDNLITSGGFPQELFPSVPASGDILYIGIDSILTDATMMLNAIFNIGTPAIHSGAVPVWEYYYSGSWSTLDTTVYFGDGTNDGSGAFTISGPNKISLDQQSQDAVEINGVTAYWARCVLQSGMTQVPTQKDYPIYMATKSYVEIQSSEIGGDIPANMRMEISYDNPATSSALGFNRSIIGVRSVSRGADFTPTINIGETNNNAAITVAVPGAQTAFGTSQSVSASGSHALFDATTYPIAYTEQATITIAAPLSQQYRGRFRIMLRAISFGYNGLSSLDYSVGAKISTGSGGIAVGTPTRYYQDGSTSLKLVTIDLGVFDIAPAHIADTVEIALYISSVYDRTRVFLNDLWLMPVDEGLYDIRDRSPAVARYVSDGRKLVIDNVADPKRVSNYVSESSVAVASYSMTSGRQFDLTPNRRLRLYFMHWFNAGATGSQSIFDSISRVRISAAKKYLSMRGDR